MTFFLLLFVAWSIYLFTVNRRMRADLAHAQHDARKALDALQKMEAEVQNLAKYRHIPDAERHARALVATAQEEANKIIGGAADEAKRLAEVVTSSTERVEALRSTVVALKNVTSGYGDAYIIPTHTLLDDLAADFDFTQAGVQLKSARENTRRLVKDRRAAECKYVEEHRRSTAIAFVTDAFNGKVDSILADVKADNAGTLRQKILDAFALVNHNGEAFKEARITQAYLDSRLDELKWAVVAMELKQRDKEEQRALKERIREEERAQREFEKAQRDAAKEEDLVRRAMEKAQRELGKANAEQKAVYEAQLVALQQQLEAAQLKNQRALSMAQQTKIGHVYIISNVGSFGENIYKIGMTRREEPMDRVRELGDASVPFSFDVHALIKSDDAPALEHAIHKCFVDAQVNKVNPRKEFFRLSLAEIRAKVEELQCQASWTMEAARKEHLETIAIEKTMKENPLLRARWEQRQISADTDIALQTGEQTESNERDEFSNGA